MTLSESDQALVMELAAELRVIADVNRLRILRLLMRQESCVCDLMEALGLRQSLLSHHLGVLRRAGLIQDRREAQWVYYSIAPDKLDVINTHFRQLLDTAHLGSDAAYGASPHKCA